ncbi:MAG: ribosome silencing factor [Endomicrobia bacterium]|nr:ribosome silencing factor [Endomicrobiia bacterium]
MSKIDFLKMAEQAAKIADGKKAVRTVILDVRDLTAIANYFVITTAESTPQINAICGEIEKTFKEKGMPVVRREGVSSASWRVLDYGGLVVHVMSPHVRDLYNLEKLWNDAKIIKTDIPVIKIQKPEIVEKIEEKFNESAEKIKKAAKKAARAAKKKIFKEKKAMQKKYARKINNVKKDAEKKAARTLKKIERKADKSVKEVKKSLKKANSRISRVKRTVKAVGKGIEAFGKTLIKKSK